jgi:hypothetical protein
VADRVALAWAIRTGEPPPDRELDPAVLALIERRRAQFRGARKTGPWICGAIVLLNIVAAVSGHSAVQFTIAILSASSGVTAWIQGSRGITRMDRLEAAVRARSTA